MIDFNDKFENLPEILKAKGTAAFERLDTAPMTLSNEAIVILSYGFAMSDYIARMAQQYPHFCQLIIQALSPETATDPAKLSEQLLDVDDEDQGFALIRQFRHQHMVLIAFQDLCLEQTIEQSMIQVSQLADDIICASYDWLYRLFIQKFGTPMYQGKAQPMHIIGMGKLGGRELNFSSDIDLIFCYPHLGTTQGARRTLENQTFFTRLGQKIIAALGQITEHGQAFRVDMRLRPMGDSGPLVIHQAGFADYYRDHGRQWERYAMVKARVINPEPRYYQSLMAIIKPFVFRRYIDYSVIDGLREMQRLIKQEVRRRGLVDNIKLGAGGIREAEFIVQSIQLIRGGKLDALCQPSFLPTLEVLLGHQLITEMDYQDIREHYLLLRQVEHYLQQFDDQQTQCLPSEELHQQRLNVVLRQTQYSASRQQISHAMLRIREQFELLTGGSPEQAQAKPWQYLIDLWADDFSQQEWAVIVPKKLEQQQQAVVSLIADAHHISQRKTVGERGTMLSEQLFPTMLGELFDHQPATSTVVIKGVLSVLLAICGRTAYLDLLLENAPARKQLIVLCQASSLIAEQISQFPLLLDELINPALLYQPMTKQDHQLLLRQSMLRIEADDLEQQMEGLRQFKLSQQLKIAALDVSNALTVMQVSDHLSYLAEALLSYAIETAWQQMQSKYGQPTGLVEGDRGLLVVAYGKFGGLELSYGSDLDLVFLHGTDASALTDGNRQIENGKFYQRLVQRVVHILNTATHTGKLYETDLRLRPQGGAGLLVCHINGFERYQRQDAWTWEHQAVTRSRCVFGSTELRNQFSQIRQQIICMPREPEQLRLDVTSMRQKMVLHLNNSSQPSTLLKQAPGGIVDIEFMTQYWSLLHSHEIPQLAVWSDNVRILEQLAANKLITVEEQQILTDSYLLLRNQAHKLSLNAEFVIDRQQIVDLQAQVQRVWQHHLG